MLIEPVVPLVNVIVSFDFKLSVVTIVPLLPVFEATMECPVLVAKLPSVSCPEATVIETLCCRCSKVSIWISNNS